jgi:sulfide dehydrogenase cytochrome subunit
MIKALPVLVLIVLLGPGPLRAGPDLGDLLAGCDGCHGTLGVSDDPTIPIIAGQPEPLIANAHEQFKDWERPCSERSDPDDGSRVTSMCTVSESLDSITINQIATHYAGQAFRPARQAYDADLAVEGARLHQMYCSSCHPNGADATGYAGHLGGQWTPYLRRALAQIRAEEMRVPRIMEHKMSQFSEAETEALLHFWASQQE